MKIEITDIKPFEFEELQTIHLPVLKFFAQKLGHGFESSFKSTEGETQVYFVHERLTPSRLDVENAFPKFK